MRLRLDKLVLSAGLALAMVVTTIPAIAGTPTASTKESAGLSLNGKTVAINDTNGLTTTEGKAFAKAQKGVEEDGAAQTFTGYEGKITSITVTENAESTNAVGDYVKNAAKSDGMTLVDPTTGSTTTNGVKLPTYTITVTSKYTKVLEGLDLSGAVDESQNDTAIIETELEANDTVKQALEAANNAIKGEGITIQTVEPSVGKTSYTEDEAKKVDVTITTTTETVYTIDTLVGGYTYDYLANNDEKYEYKVYKQLAKDNTCENQEYTVVNDGASLKISVTDLTSTYVLGRKEVSSSGNLFFGDDEDGEDATEQAIKVTDTVSLTVVSTIADDVLPKDKAAFKAVADEIGATVAGYFNANLSNGEPYTDSEVTIKIVKPRDIEALAGEGKTIKYTVIRSHEGMPVEALETNSDGEYITFSSKYFSTYALAYEIVDAVETPAEDPTEDPTTAAPAQEDPTQAPATTPEPANGPADKSATGVKGGDNSMMPLFMTTLLLALCAGSLAIYKEKKTN